MEIFLHQRTTETAFIKVDPSTKVGAFGIECLGDGASVWLEDGKEMLDPEKTLAEAGVVERCHVHVSSCKAVVVKVRFAGQTIEESFPPAATAGSILKWAASPEGFKLTDSQAAKHLLAGLRDEHRAGPSGPHRLLRGRRLLRLPRPSSQGTTRRVGG